MLREGSTFCLYAILSVLWKRWFVPIILLETGRE